MECHARVLLGVALGCAYARWGLGREAGSTPRLRPTVWPFLYRGMVLIPLPGHTERALHLHHWLLYALALPYLAPHPVAWGAALSLVGQGLQYEDSLQFVVPRPTHY